RLGVAGIADEADDALRLAERIGAHEMGALGKLFGRADQLADLLAVGRVAGDRQAERRLGDEDVAVDRLERFAGRVGPALVVAGCDDAGAAVLDAYLRGAQYMAGGMEGHRDTVDIERFAKICDLGRSREILAV